MRHFEFDPLDRTGRDGINEMNGRFCPRPEARVERMGIFAKEVMMPLPSPLLFFLALTLSIQAQQATPAAGVPDQASLNRALAVAADKGQLDKVKALVKQGASVKAPPSQRTSTPLMFAAYHRHDDVVAYLVQQGADVNATVDGATALQFAALNDDLPACATLLNAGANPDLGNPTKRLPILYPARFGDAALMKLFLDHHANVNITGDSGPALWEAVAGGRLEVARMLLEAGANVHLRSTTRRPDPDDPLLSMCGAAAARNNLPMVDLLLAHGASLEDRSENGRTVLEEAILHGTSATVVDLLTRGADPNARDDAGLTPMTLAIQYQSPATIAVLLDHGAKIEATDPSGATPLIEAGKHGTLEAVELLVTRGARIDAADLLGETALTYAGDRGCTDVVTYLKKVGAKRTDVHVIARPAAHPALSPAQAWSLALAALYFQLNGDNPHCLRSEDWRTVAGTRAVLSTTWEITNRGSLLAKLAELRDDHHRKVLVAHAETLAQIPDVLWQMEVKDPLQAYRRDQILSSYRKWGNRMMLAWDVARYVFVVHLGVLGRFIGQEEAWQLIQPFAQEVQGQFASWREFSENFLDSRNRETTYDPGLGSCAQLLLNPQDPNSVWNQVPWKTDLGK